MSLGLIVPRSATAPRHHCRLCHADFPAEQLTQFIRHVKACAKRNGDRFEAMQHERNSNVFTSPADPERYDHIRAGGN